MVTHVGETINWTLRGFHNPTGNTVANFSIVDVPGRGLNFRTGHMPAFTNGAGITYEIRYTVAGSNEWRVLSSNIDAGRPFTFHLPQSGSMHYTAIGFFFGTVPAGFALGNEIVLTFVVGNDAPNNILVNNFWISYDNIVRDGDSPYRPIVIQPPNVNGNNTLVPAPDGNGYFELDDDNVPLGQWTWNDNRNEWIFNGFGVGPMPQTGFMDHALWLASALFLATSAGLGTMSYMKAKKRKRKGATA